MDKVVEEALHSLANYTAYRGLTGITSAGPAAETASKPSNLQAIAAVADPAYWLANIAHQGRAGLNANPSTCPHGIP
jgi:glucan 1,3-beta-glucosidase